MDFPGQDKRAVFEPSRVVIERVSGTLIEARDDPEKSFEGQQRETPWDDIHVTYFAGEGLVDIPQYPVSLHPRRIQHRGDPIDSGRGRNLAAAELDLPG